MLIYAYAVGERSSRRIERRLVEDVTFRVVAANQLPDHATVARFRTQHQDAIAQLFGQVLPVCARAGVQRPGLVAIDGTKLTANASREANRTGAELAERILAEAAAIDAAEDTAQPEAGHRGLPSAAGARASRRTRIRALLDELLAEEAEKSYETHMAKRAEIKKSTRKPIRGRRPSPMAATHKARQQVNLSDPDSRLLKTKGGYIQGYNAQAVATQQQFIVAAEVTNCAHDAPPFVPMITAAKRNLKTAGEQRRLRRGR